MHIASIALDVETAVGQMRGKVDLAGGLNIVSAPNGFGKSLMLSAVAWCLGVEAMYGVRPGDKKFFGAAVLTQVQTPSGMVPVQRSCATVVLQTEDGGRLELQRAIIGGDVSVVKIAETLPGGQAQEPITLRANIAFSNSNAGLQPFLYERMGMPPQRAVRNDGADAWLYLENLAPFFFVEQTVGWTDVAATQVYRYKLQDVNPTAVEYMLGAHARLAFRLHAQSRVAAESALREEAGALRREADDLLGREGFAIDLGARTSLGPLLKTWADLDIKAELLERYSVNFSAERLRLDERMTALREEISGSRPSLVERFASSEAAARVSDLKTKRRELVNQASALRLEAASTAETLDVLLARERSAKDLLAFKRDGVGLATAAACPTCHQDIEPRRFGLESAGTDLTALQVKAVERDRRVMQNALEANHQQARAVSAQLQEVEESLRSAQRAVSSVDAAMTGGRESLAKAAHDLAECEHEREKLDTFERRIDSLQEQLRAWVKRATDLLDETSQDCERDVSQIARFESRVREAIQALGHTGVHAGQRLELDDRYVVTCEQRELRSLGAASDRARLVTAYTTGLLRASLEVTGHHPGFLVLDEPKQQNPDEKHDSMAETFWRDVSDWAAEIGAQVIVATYLRSEDLSRFAGTRAHLLSYSSEKFLVPWVAG